MLKTMQVASRPSAPSTTPYRPKLVAVGDSLTAGMQDANLIGERQEVSYPALIARQAGLEFRQPLLNKEGAPPRLFLSPGTSLAQTAWRYAQVMAAAAPVYASLALGWAPPEFTLLPLMHAGGMGHAPGEKPWQNLAVPGFELREVSDVKNIKSLMKGMTNKAEGSGELIATGPYVKQILQDGGSGRRGASQIDKAVEQDPDLVIYWAGNNDALASAITGHVDDRSLTPLNDQKWTYHSYNPVTGKRTPHQTESVQPGFKTSLNKQIGTLLKKTDAEIVMMNVPDVTVVPFLHELGDKVGRLPFKLVLPGGVDVTAKLENWTLPRQIKGEGKDGRAVFPAHTRVGLPMILSKLTHYFKVQSEKDVDVALATMARGEGVFSEDEVLDPDEIATIQKRTADFNQLIADLDKKHDRIHLVDANSLLSRAQKEGIALRGEGPEVKVTNTFTHHTDERGFRGIFSGDGIHPSDIGYAVVANRVLDTLKTELKDDPRFECFLNAAPVDEKAALQADPHLGERPTLMLMPYVTEALQKIL
jgi:lysophospholipase L1-like esterase